MKLRYNYEYRRNGTVNLFVLLDVHRSWWKVTLTERRTEKDYSQCMATSSTSIIPMPRSSMCRIIYRLTSPAPVSHLPARRSTAHPHCLTKNVTGQHPFRVWGGAAKSVRWRLWQRRSACA